MQEDFEGFEPQSELYLITVEHYTPEGIGEMQQQRPQLLPIGPPLDRLLQNIRRQLDQHLPKSQHIRIPALLQHPLQPRQDLLQHRLNLILIVVHLLLDAAQNGLELVFDEGQL